MAAKVPPAEMVTAANAIGAAVQLAKGHRGMIDLRPAGSGRWVAQLRIKSAAGKEAAPAYYEVKRGKGKQVVARLLGSDGASIFAAVPYGTGWLFKLEAG